MERMQINPDDRADKVYPLDKLPAEIRNNIYEMVLCEDEPIHIGRWTRNSMSHVRNQDKQPNGQARPRITAPTPSLLGVSRSVRKEALQMYYSINAFYMVFDAQPEGFSGYFARGLREVFHKIDPSVSSQMCTA